MDRSLDEIISERPQRSHGSGGGAGRRPDRRAPPPPRGPRRDRDRDEGPRDGVRKNRRDERSDIDGDWVHDRYEEDRAGRRRGGYDDDDLYDRRAPARRAPDDDTGKVRVDNLHYELTEDDISELFNRIGPVLSARLLYDRSDRSQGTAFVTYEDPRDARDAVREFDGANANGQPIRLTLLSSAPRRAPAADRGSLFDRIEKPSRSMFERIDSSEDVPRRRGGGGRRDDRSYSPPRRGLRVPEGVDRYEPGGRDSRSPLPGRRGGGRERGGRRPGARRDENGRDGGRGKKEGGRSGPRPKKTAEELDAEMEDYFGGNGGAAAENNNGTAQQQNGGGAAPAATSAPAAVGDDDIDMIE